MSAKHTSTKNHLNHSVRQRGEAEPLKPEAFPVPARWAWHFGTLQSLRDQLLKDRGDQIAEAVEPLEPHSMSIADSATDEFDHDLALALLSHEQRMLHDVDAALNRIREGTYGLCEESGKPISSARLRAIPWTRYSIEAAEQLERQGELAGPHLGALGSAMGSPGASMAQVEEPEVACARDEEPTGQELGELVEAADNSEADDLEKTDGQRPRILNGKP